MKRFRLALGLLAAGSALAPAAAAAQGQPYGVYREDPGSALNRHLRTLADQPRNLSALMGAGKAALQLGDAQAALTFFARAEEIAPRDGRVKAGMGSAFVQMEQAQAALKFFQDAASLGVPEAEFSGDRGLAHDLTGNPRQAQLDYAAALRREDNDEVRRRLALSLAITGQRDQALAAIDGQLRRQDRIAWRTRAFILALTGDAAEATRTAQSVMPTLAGQMQPFFARLPALTPAQRAMAVHFGHFPEHGLQLPVPSQQYASAAPAQAAARTQARQSTAPRRSAAPQAVSTEPRRRPGGEEQRATRQQTQQAQQTASRTRTEPRPQRQTESAASLLADRYGLTGRGPAGRPRQAEQRRPTALAQAQTQRPPAAVPVQPRQSPPAAAVVPAPVQAPVQAPISTPIQTPPAAVAQAPLQAPPASPPAAAPLQPQAQTPAASQPLSNVVASTIEAQTPPAAAPAPQAPAATAEAPPAAAPAATPIADPAPASAPALAVAQTAPAPASPEPAPAAAVPGPAMAFENIAAAIAALPAEPAPVPAQTKPVELAQATERPRAATTPTPAPKPPAPKPAAPKPAAKKEEPAKKPEKAADKKEEPAKKAAAKDEPAKKAAAKEAPAKKPAAKEDPAKKEPSRHWVQIAGGANKAGLPREYEKLQEKAPKLLAGKAAWTTPLRFTNRLLVGPFKSEKEAQAFVNELNKLDFTAFSWTSPAGQEIEKLPLK